MKKIFLILTSLSLTYAGFAQNALFTFDNGEGATDVSRLGTAPEFPFLMNKSSANDFYQAIKKHAGENSAAMSHLNGLLAQIGYTNGAEELEASDVTMEYVKPGTVGNMGSRGYTYGFYRLTGDASEFKAWKIVPNGGNAAGALYFFAKCGNAFYPMKGRTACVMVPVQVTPDVNQITLPSSGSKVTAENKSFVYYERKRHSKKDRVYPVTGLNVQYPSDPLPISKKMVMDIRPETYTVSLDNSTKTDVAVCANQTMNLTANVNVEKTATYTGNYPSNNNTTYLKVSKRHYKMMARKMHNAERKANKVAKRTKQPVVVTKA